ncbi:GSCFA domain-containing protein [Pseudooceanicola sp. CBS1P-1]|uniref:GSCFA domain-containing protein n=1 Tax=Pseudooceanicola albus TaxID=2692189 RepID=A0A6L7G6F1_9RHOB|nr:MULTISPECIES: GSCFA domain-containing protein [Pseudooceanicola]MBT9385624.1 GSCFA domain-containing protein [Pseudooceanicola endophyticus]MXN18966.1 hypothetical protein [Pseudooceanicola albus]
MREFDGAEAFAGALRNRHRRFPGRDDPRSRDAMLVPGLSPGFTLAPGEGVFTIGSCFARNVEKALLAHGLSVPTAAFTAPEEEAPGQPNRLLNQYNPGTMLQCLEDLEVPLGARALYEAGPGMVLDALLATGGRPVARARALARRQEIRTLYARGLSVCSTVVVTLGLVEAWFDRADGLYLNEAPGRAVLNAHPGRFVFRQLGPAECRSLLDALLARLLERDRRVLLTVSPVPLQATFAGGDAICRNAYSKAVLRVVAEEAARDHPRVDYFPSYEMVTSAGLTAYGEDQVHVRPRVVDQVIATMTAAYAPGQPAAAE